MLNVARKVYRFLSSWRPTIRIHRVFGNRGSLPRRYGMALSTSLLVPFCSVCRHERDRHRDDRRKRCKAESCFCTGWQLALFSVRCTSCGHPVTFHRPAGKCRALGCRRCSHLKFNAVTIDVIADHREGRQMMRMSKMSPKGGSKARD